MQSHRLKTCSPHHRSSVSMCGSGRSGKRLPIRACLHSQSGFRYLHPKNFSMDQHHRECTVKYSSLKPGRNRPFCQPRLPTTATMETRRTAFDTLLSYRMLPDIAAFLTGRSSLKRFARRKTGESRRLSGTDQHVFSHCEHSPLNGCFSLFGFSTPPPLYDELFDHLSRSMR